MSIEIKKKLGEAAAEFIADGMIVGLGTGTTAEAFILSLIERVKKGLSIRCVSSSLRSAKLAEKGGLTLIDIDQAPYIDLTVDGADEVDKKRQIIKGRGGALLREKILASASKEMVVIVEETKLVSFLGKSPLPVEVIPYGSFQTKKHLQNLGYLSSFRLNQDGEFYQTENGNFILDITFDHLLKKPKEEHVKISQVPGVVETGFFFDLASRILVGSSDGKVKLL